MALAWKFLVPLALINLVINSYRGTGLAERTAVVA
jgi:NADH:ubiquinone oxidoreductase subunit H